MRNAKTSKLVAAKLVAAVAWTLVAAGSASAAEHEHTLKVGKKGEITFDKETKVGDLTLKPGRYFFQHRVEGEDHFVHFTEVTKEPSYYGGGAGGGGVPKAHPGEVKCKLEPLSKKVQATTLELDTEGGVNRVTRVEVAGENVAHVF
jgi:hypothetical protein